MHLRTRLAPTLVSFLLLFSCSTAQKAPAEIETPQIFTSDGIETIVIMGTNDIHGALATETLKTREAEGVTPIEYQAGGAATLASYVRILRDEFGDRFLWLDAGDEFQGTIESNMQKGKGMVQFFNLTSLGGAAVGNHEFDYGPEIEGDTDVLGALKARMREARYPYLAANIIDRKTQELAEFPNTYPHKMYQVGKLKVGVIGLSTLDTPKTTRTTYVRGLQFADLKESTMREAKALRQSGADVILVTAHVGLRCDRGNTSAGHSIRKISDPAGECGTNDEMVEFLRSLPSGTVDAVVSGHSHSLVHHWVAGVPVIQAGSLGRYFNLIYLNYDLKNRRIVPESTRIEGPVPVCPKVFQNQADCNGERPAPRNGRGKLVTPRFHKKTVTPDSSVTALLQPVFEQAAVKKNEYVAEAARPMNPDRQKETALGNFVADAVRDAVGADIALVNAGGIRAPIEQGAITYGGVFRVLPFDNGIVTLKVSGKELLEIIRVGESGSRGFCPTSGLKLKLIGPEYDVPSNDMNGDGKIEPWEANRLLEVRLADGSPIKPEKTYTLATIDFLVTGGDDVGAIMEKIPAERQIHSDWLIREAAVKYLRKLAAAGPINSIERPLYDPANPRMVFSKPAEGKKKKTKGKRRRR